MIRRSGQATVDSVAILQDFSFAPVAGVRCRRSAENLRSCDSANVIAARRRRHRPRSGTYHVVARRAPPVARHEVGHPPPPTRHQRVTSGNVGGEGGRGASVGRETLTLAAVELALGSESDHQVGNSDHGEASQRLHRKQAI